MMQILSVYIAGTVTFITQRFFLNQNKDFNILTFFFNTDNQLITFFF